MNIALLGFDVEGKASYEYFAGRGDTVTICDQNAGLEVPGDAASQLGENYLDNLDRFDLLVRTPGLHPNKILQKNPGVGSKITSGTNEFFRVSPTQSIIGVTGTKGKGTTSTLIAKMLKADGRQTFLGGNIGVPALSFVDKVQANSWVVLESSSFQLIDLHTSPHISLCLMVVPEHLNWHSDMNEYLTAKSQLFAHQSPQDIAIYFDGNENSRKIAAAGGGRKIPYFAQPGAIVEDGNIVIDGQRICATGELKLLGQHNWQNVCAAVTTVWQVTQNIEAIRSVLTTFGGLEHRLELVRELEGIRYYDDSFGTTPETAIVAMQALAEPKVVILGGSDKGASYHPLAQAVKDNNVRKALLIGAEAAKIQAALEEVGFTDFISGGNTMDEIVSNARRNAVPGDSVLLSTGCASFGMFKDYKDRGDQFKQQVLALS